MTRPPLGRSTHFIKVLLWGAFFADTLIMGLWLGIIDVDCTFRSHCGRTWCVGCYFPRPTESYDDKDSTVQLIISIIVANV